MVNIFSAEPLADPVQCRMMEVEIGVKQGQVINITPRTGAQEVCLSVFLLCMLIEYTVSITRSN